MTSAASAAAADRHAPVVLLGYGEGHGHIDPNSAEKLTEFPAARLAADTAFGDCRIRRDDVDVAGIGEHFTIGVLIGLEDAGFCGPGEGGAFVAGDGTAIGGRLPVNTSGGFLSFSHAGHCGVWEQAAGLGFAAMPTPEQFGGAGTEQPLLDLVIIAEEMGRQLAAGPLLQAGTPAQQEQYLPGLADGSLLAAWAVGDPGDQWEPGAAATTARHHGPDWVLTGRKLSVEAADLLTCSW